MYNFHILRSSNSIVFIIAGLSLVGEHLNATRACVLTMGLVKIGSDPDDPIITDKKRRGRKNAIKYA